MFEDVVKLAIFENKMSREMNRKTEELWEKSTHRSRYFKERCTVHVDIGRASGKTNYIINHATCQDVIITFSKIGEQLLLDKLGRKAENIFWTINALVGKTFTDVEIVYIDEPALFCRNQKCDLMDVYRLFTKCKDTPLFVLLGE